MLHFEDYIKTAYGSSIRCLGTGNGYPSSRRGHSCYLYDLDGVRFLIDCGEPASCNFKRNRINWNAPKAVIVSHLHFDHSGGLFMLLQGFWLERRKEPLKIYLPQDGIKPIEELLRAASFVPEIISFEYEFIPIREGETVQIGDVVVMPVLNSHYDSFKAQVGDRYGFKYESFSFLIRKGDLKIAHTADVGSIKDVERLVENGVDTLVCELSHIKPEELFELVASKKPRLLVLVHLDGRYRAGVKELLTNAEKMLSDVKCIVPDDGMEIYIQTKKAVD
ncbi:MAG: MBL fold metallo-hydrolase [Verrucomicrobiia bacterium]